MANQIMVDTSILIDYFRKTDKSKAGFFNWFKSLMKFAYQA